MKKITSIRLLGRNNNERGDLFTRLTKDLFFALGYDDLRLDVHKAGREIDIQGTHRLEPRLVIGECKAHAAKMGGAELNKFYGVLTREREKHNQMPVVGYFVSLSGFTQSGIEQEEDSKINKSILLDASKIVRELENCRVIVGFDKAREKAGECLNFSKITNAEVSSVELIGHKHGYIYVITYSSNNEDKYFAMIHADGSLISKKIANEIIIADQNAQGVLHSLHYLEPPSSLQSTSIVEIELKSKVISQYKNWLIEECGFIHLDGLPADNDLSATKLKLERLFVPLKVIFDSNSYAAVDEEVGEKSSQIISIGKMIEQTPHLAILAMPGGGKSTLIKRLATAYAFPERRKEVDDDLPEKKWLPIVLRCRELKDRAHRPILELLSEIPQKAGMNNTESNAFQNIVHNGLKTGETLLLIDGLDEIADEGARQSFANNLRTFIGMFPEVAVVITSRQAGFRLVAGVVASACIQATLAPLDEKDVIELCVKWHTEVINDSAKVRQESKELAKAIWENRRIRILSENPLLLTTLLVVKRWVQELPKSRAALYREAIRVLVRTWNVEGYAPLDEEEALAQLSYIACSMMEDGKQQIGQKALLALLKKARIELDAELQFTKISPQDFIERIEYRSSLLVQVGYKEIDGINQPLYEFRHLTFQEYLAARGYVEEQYPGRDSDKSLAEVLENHFHDETWQEVIPIAAVLAGRKSEELILRLASSCQQLELTTPDVAPGEENFSDTLLYQCVLDEVTISSSTLRIVLNELASESGSKSRGNKNLHHSIWVPKILNGKFGLILQELVENEYCSDKVNFDHYLSAMQAISEEIYFPEHSEKTTESVILKLDNDFNSDEALLNIRAALVCMALAYNIRTSDTENYAIESEFLSKYTTKLIEMATEGKNPARLAAAWALAWYGTKRILKSPPKQLINSLLLFWKEMHLKPHAHFPAWAISTQGLLPRDTFDTDILGEDFDKFLKSSYMNNFSFGSGVRKGSLTLGWYNKSPWSDDELVTLIAASLEEDMYLPRDSHLAILETLGDKGKQAVDQVRKKLKKEEVSLD